MGPCEEQVEHKAWSFRLKTKTCVSSRFNRSKVIKDVTAIASIAQKYGRSRFKLSKVWELLP